MNAPRQQAHLPTATRPRHPIRRRGFSMVELLVALTIGLFLSAGVIQLFLGTRQTYRFEEALARLQENGRYALETIARDLRMVGFAGCRDLAELESFTADELSNVTLISADIDEDKVKPVSNTDFVRLRLLSDDTARLNANMTGAGGPIPIASNPGAFDNKDTLAITDCGRGEVFQPGAVTSTTITLDGKPSLSRTYGVDSLVMRLRDVTYYVNQDGGLWRSGDRAGQVIDGVEDMEFLFGEDIDNDGMPDRYRAHTATLAVDWARVRSVRISLLLVSQDTVLNDGPHSFVWRGDTVTRNDHRLRQVFSTTVALRNRLQ